MKASRSALAGLAFAAMPAFSAVPLVSPIARTTNDTVVPQPQKIALGRFPSGQYNVQLVSQGGVMRVESGPTGTGAGTGILTSFQFIGQGRFTPSGTFDRARFESVGVLAVTRNLSRFRF